MEYENAQLNAEMLEAEQLELDYIWKDLVRSVLSNTRIDPKYQGREVEYFLPYKAEVTREQVAALQESKYGVSFKHFVRLWRTRAENNNSELWQVAEVFRSLSELTGSPYRSIRVKEQNNIHFNDLELLRNVVFLTIVDDKKWHIDIQLLEGQLNAYIALGIEWPQIERILLITCINCAVEEENSKAKLLSDILAEPIFKKNIMLGAIAMIVMRLSGLAAPILLWLAFNGGILFWSLNILQNGKPSLLASIGLIWVAISIPVGIIHYGTTETRHLLRKIVQPGWDRHKAVINSDLMALNKAINSYPVAHINLRLAREQLTRLQGTDVKLPVQLMTIIDRSIANGQHHW